MSRLNLDEPGFALDDETLRQVARTLNVGIALVGPF